MPPKGSSKAAIAAAAAAAQDKDKDTLNGSPPPAINSGPMTAAQKQAAPYMAGLHDFELQKSVIQRLAKGAVRHIRIMLRGVSKLASLPAPLATSTVSPGLADWS